jgi:hypothetical protein
MTDDAWLIASVSLVWSVLAALYAFVPVFHMPSSAQVWGAGALIFVALTILTAVVEGKARRRVPRDGPPAPLAEWTEGRRICQPVEQSESQESGPVPMNISKALITFAVEPVAECSGNSGVTGPGEPGRPI